MTKYDKQDLNNNNNNEDKLSVKFSRNINEAVPKYTEDDLSKTKTKSIIQTMTALIIAILIGLGSLYMASNFITESNFEFINPDIELPETDIELPEINIEFEEETKNIETIKEAL